MASRSLNFIYVALAFLLASGLVCGTQADESIVMPFSCAVKAGKPTLSSAAPTRHGIIGQRKTRDYRACKVDAGGDCRSMVVHRFEVDCQGVSASWHVLAAQIRSNEVGSSWIENGELHLILQPPVTGSNKRRKVRFVMPQGYAPISELGVSILESQAVAVIPADGTSAAPIGEASVSGPPADPELPGGSKRITPTIDNAVVVTPVAHEETPGKALKTDGQWAAVVHPADDPSESVVRKSDAPEMAFAQGQGLGLLIVVLAATSLVAALGWYGRRYAFGASQRELAPAMPQGLAEEAVHSEPGRLLSRVTSAAGGVGAKLHSRWVGFKWRRLKAGKPWEWNNASIANGARSAEALYEMAHAAVQALGPASALRDTLSGELKSVRQKLDGLRAGSGEKPQTARVAASLRAVVRDLERIGRIAESAAVSVRTGRDEIVMPKTRAEAFEVLGVNANVTEGALKRIVDALRMGWHPDYAKDEVDKRLREERTKQINIAWDLIVGKRMA